MCFNNVDLIPIRTKIDKYYFKVVKIVHTTQNLWNYFQNDKNNKGPFTPRIITITITILVSTPTLRLSVYSKYSLELYCLLLQMLKLLQVTWILIGS